MSCFGGRMQEYDRVSLDRFDGKNLQSTVYFLSHLHEDHTVGLAEKLFHKRLKSNKDIFLYCSEVTQVLLVASKKYRHLKPFIKGLSINTPTTIVIPDPLFEEKEKITVTLLPAFHCPGSVMFLIEGGEGTVLYTGDFRWEHFNIEQMHHLRSGDSVKKIKSLYVDTTFCTPDNLYIPSRQQCIDAVCQLVREWTSISPKHIVNISLRAQYGHEPLLNAVASRLGKKVHVNEYKVEVYNRIQEFHGNFTSDGINTQLHACNRDCMIEVDGEQVLCREAHDSDKILVVLPTTMYFTQFAHLTLDKIIKKINSNFFRACYSFHSSYTEVKDLISYLKPDKVFPNVKPPSDKSLPVTQHRLNNMLKECKEEGVGEIIYPQEVKELGTLKTRSGRQANKRKGRESTSDAESLDFGTPVKNAKFSFSSSMEAGEPASPASSTSKKKGRGRGRGKDKVETASQPAIGTRRSTRRSAATPPSSQEITPKKSKKSERSPTPDLFLTPASDTSDQHSSFCGSERSDSELSLFSSQKSFDFPASDETGGSWAAGSFLAAISSYSEDDSSAGRYCVVDDDEQTDKHFDDSCPFVETEDEDENVTSKQSEPIIPKDDVDGDTDPSGIKSKGNKTSPAKRGRRGKMGKNISGKMSKEVTCTEPEQEQNTGGDKEHSVECNTNVNEEKVDEVEELKTVVKDNDKSSLGTPMESEESAPKVDTALEKLCPDKGDISKEYKTNRDKEGDNSFVSDDSVMDIPVKTNIDQQNNLGIPLEVCQDTTVKFTETNHVKEVKEGEKNEPEGTSEESKVIVNESSEELHLHLSESTHDRVEDYVDENGDLTVEDILIIQSDSGEDDKNGDQVNNDLPNTETISKKDQELNDEIVCSNSGSSSGAILITDSDSNEVSNQSDGKVTETVDELETEQPVGEEKLDVMVTEDDVLIVEDNVQHSQEDKSQVQSKDSTSPLLEKNKVKCTDTEELMMVEENGQNSDVKVNQVEKDDNDEVVQIISLESTNSEIPESLKGTNGDETACNKVVQDDPNDDDDDVIEIVDLTGDDNTGQVDNRENVKPGKKAIKISLLTKTENLKKNKRDNNSKTDELEEDVIYTGDNDDSDEMENSQEWLSVKKGRVRKDITVAKKSKKMKGNKAKSTTSMGIERSGLNDSEYENIDADKNEAEKIDKLEMEERAEVRRQAVGFMCETDSESDTDESSDPDSPEADLLYDDYVELSSDSDHEGGVGRKGIGKNSKTNKRTSSKGDQSGDSKSRSDNQGWLTSRKCTPGSESAVQESLFDINSDKETDNGDKRAEQADNELNEKTSDNIIENLPQKYTSSNSILFEQSANKKSTCSDKESGLQKDLVDLEKTHSMISDSTTHNTIKTDDLPASDTLKELIKESSSSKSLKSENETHQIDDSEQGTTDNTLVVGVECDKAEMTNIKQKTEFGKENATYTSMGNSDKETHSIISEDIVIKTGEAANVFSGNTSKVRDTSKENVLMQVERSFQSDESHEEVKMLQSAKEAGENLSQVSKQKCNKMTEKSDIIKKDDTLLNKETLPSTTKREVDSTSLSTTDNLDDGNKKKPKKPKIVDWRKLPPAKPSKISFVSDIINQNDQPAPPGTEEIPVPAKPKITKPEVKTISSVISRGRKTKVFQKNTPASTSQSPPSASSHKPLYNLFVGGVNPPVNTPSYNYSYPNPSQVQQFQNYPPPGWGQYPYGPPPAVPFPLPTTPTQPPPSLPYPSAVQFPTVGPTIATSTVVTVPSYPPPSVTYSTSLYVATCTATQSTTSKPSVTSTLKQSVTSGSSPRSKKLLPWQQKKAEMFDRGPSCIAKKEIKETRTVTIKKKSPKPIQEEKLFSQSSSVSVPYKHTESGITDLATIKANISALTGLSVTNTVNTKSSIPAESEELPALFEQLTKLKKVQAVIDAMKPQSETNQYDMSKQTGVVDLTSGVDDDRMSAWSGRLSRDEGYDEEYRQRSNRYEDREREDGRYHSRDYSDLDRRERGFEQLDTDYKHADRRVIDYNIKERDFEYDRRERVIDYDRKERDLRYIRRERDFEYDRRGQGFEYDRRERDLEYERGRELRREPVYERRSREFERDDREYFEHERREREFELRYREDEEYRLWLEERRRRDAYRGFSRESPPRHPRYDDSYHRDPYYDRRPRDPEYDVWMERQRHREYPGRVRHDSYDRYEEQPRQKPIEMPRTDSLYIDHPTRLQNEIPEARFGSLHGTGTTQLEENNYSVEEAANPRELPETRASQVYQPPKHAAHAPYADRAIKKPIMARVFSRSGQFVATQPGWKSTQQSTTVSSTSEREDPVDQPVFLTGMKYYDDTGDH